jgi:hypothetical protein
MTIRSSVDTAGFEPATSRMSSERSNQLSYESFLITVGMVGFEPTCNQLSFLHLIRVREYMPMI